MTKGDDVAAEAKLRVEQDIRSCFENVLRPQDHADFVVGLQKSDLDGMQALTTSDELVAVPWHFPCTHVGTFLDIPATGVDLELQGTTFVDIRIDNADEWTYYRYIDFIGALHQLGVPTDGRPVIASDD